MAALGGGAVSYERGTPVNKEEEEEEEEGGGGWGQRHCCPNPQQWMRLVPESLRWTVFQSQ